VFRKFLQLAGVEWIRAEMDWFYILVRGHAAFGSRLLSISLRPLRLCVNIIPSGRGPHAKTQRAQSFPEEHFMSVCSRFGAQPFFDLLLCRA
jgi:hypothetical protein